MKVLMYGFGSGNNIEPWLEFFERKSDTYQLTFICKSFAFDKKRFTHLSVLELTSEKLLCLSFLRKIRKEKFDVLYIQGLYDYLIIFYLFLVARGSCRVINIWNNVNYKKASRQNKRFWQIPVYQILFRMTHRFYFTWYGTYIGFTELFPKLKPKAFIQPWGIRDNIIQHPPANPSEKVRSILKGLKEDDIFLFWPEYMSEDEHIHEFLAALTQLKNYSSLRVLLFSGHQLTDTSYIQNLRKMVTDSDLGFVNILVGEYLPYQDIMALWQRADLTLKLSTKDQLSNGIIEALFFRTPMILNDWIPYQKLQEHGMKVFLTSLDAREIARNLRLIIDNILINRNYYSEIGNSNRELIIKKFNFDDNIDKLMSDLYACSKEKQGIKLTGQ
jgi:glycosyltransferase involved in cell wall biosynthesis